ncbi:MAG: hypothetical protein ACTSPZ_02380 [Promethearchaeota archaeon]
MKIFYYSNYALDSLLDPLEKICSEFNSFALIFFQYFKYIFVIVLIGCGVLILLKLRGYYFRSRSFSGKGDSNKKDPFIKPRLVIGAVYIFIGFGILFNYLIYFFIWLLEPLPDRLIFSWIKLIDIDPFNLNRITDIRSAIYPHEQTFYYIIAMLSFANTIHLTISIVYLLYRVKNPRDTILWLFSSVPGGIICGFTTFMPFML